MLVLVLIGDDTIVAAISICRWLVRAPLLLVATSELVKLRFVVVQQSQAEAPDAYGYFFWLYCAFVVVQVCGHGKSTLFQLGVRGLRGFKGQRVMHLPRKSQHFFV